MAKALVIINPAAARTRAASVDAVAAAIRSGGWEAEVLATGGPGDARVLAEYGVREGFDVVAVFGGDGTTMQAAAALVGTDVTLGVIPGGTGNLLAGNLRIPAAPARAAEIIVRGRPKRFDLGRMERPGGIQYFAVACGAGYDARVMAGTASAMKHKWKFAAYVATTFRLLDELRISRHYITVDGVEYEAEAAMVLVANCGEVIPPFVRLRSGITPDDGMLDVIVLKASNVPESVRAIWHLLRERAEGEFIRYARGQEVRVVTEPVEPVQLDGEPGGVTPFTATVVPGAIGIMVPG
ncbi:MAG TPA: diacylglycerol kinase family protein [Gemmatimonadales bacterium]|nr:diacylglycerol kinase family protein [Gemmatimonadales bacterium]